MGDLISFRGTPKPTREELSRHSEIHRAEQVRKLREALTGKPKLSAEEQLAVAHAMHGLLQRVEDQHGISKARVLVEAGIGSEGDSTKHLSQYAVPRGRMSSRLNKKAARYADIIRAATRLAKLDEDEALLEVFRNVGFWHSTGTRSAAAEFDGLAERLNWISDKVAQKHDLAGFFRTVARSGGVLTPSDQCIRREREIGRPLEPEEISMEVYFEERQSWPIEFYQPTWEAEDPMGNQVPAYPSLILGTWRIGKPFPVEVAAEVPSMHSSVERVSGTVQGRYAVNLRLCIPPVGKALDPIPALRLALGIALSPLLALSQGVPGQLGPGPLGAASRTSRPVLTFPWSQSPPLKHGVAETIGLSAPDSRQVDCKLKVGHIPVPELFKAYFGDADAGAPEAPAASAGVRFLPITGAVCEDWLGFHVRENLYDTVQQRLAGRMQGRSLAERSNWSDAIPSEFGAGILASEIDRLVCDSSNGFDLWLDETTAHIRHIYDQAYAGERRAREEGWVRIRERWGATSSTVSR